MTQLFSENIAIVGDNRYLAEVVMKKLKEIQDQANKGKSDLNVISNNFIWKCWVEIKEEIKSFDQQSNETYFNNLLAKSKYLKSLTMMGLLLDSNMTRSSVRICSNLAETITWFTLLQDKSITHQEAMDCFATDLIDYVGYFVDTEKNGELK